MRPASPAILASPVKPSALPGRLCKAGRKRQPCLPVRPAKPVRPGKPVQTAQAAQTAPMLRAGPLGRPPHLPAGKAQPRHQHRGRAAVMAPRQARPPARHLLWQLARRQAARAHKKPPAACGSLKPLISGPRPGAGSLKKRGPALCCGRIGTSGLTCAMPRLRGRWRVGAFYKNCFKIWPILPVRILFGPPACPTRAARHRPCRLARSLPCRLRHQRARNLHPKTALCPMPMPSGLGLRAWARGALW